MCGDLALHVRREADLILTRTLTLLLPLTLPPTLTVTSAPWLSMCLAKQTAASTAEAKPPRNMRLFLPSPLPSSGGGARHSYCRSAWLGVGVGLRLGLGLGSDPDPDPDRNPDPDPDLDRDRDPNPDPEPDPDPQPGALCGRKCTPR